MHGSVPNDFLSCTAVPIPKGRNVNLTDSANYRGISLSSVLGKVFDLIVLCRYSEYLESCELQFGFKPKRSTAMCSMILKEAISYYSHNNNSVYCVFLDATKAFDRVNYCKLFRLLLKRNMPPHVVRVLMNMYTGQQVRVSWNGIFSSSFGVTNGVKQGGILSPILFCVYMDILLVSLRDAGIGCFIGESFVGALAYADDIVLLAPTAHAMRRLLSICDKYGSEYSMSFNASKSKCLIFRARHSFRAIYEQLKPFVIGGNEIEFVTRWSHLGHVINIQLTDDDDVAARKSQLIGQTNGLICNFSKLDPMTRNRLFQVYCTSFYRCQIWDLYNTKSVEDFCTAWRKGMRRVWSLPANARSDAVYLVAGVIPIFDELCKWMLA